MSLLEKLSSDMITAMKNKDKQKLSVIRMLKSSLQNEQIDKGRELSDDEILTVLSRELKQRKEALHEYTKGGRTDLAESAEAELSIVLAYMPEQLDETELRNVVTDVIAHTGATSKADMGKVMGQVMPRVKGKTDGNLVKQIVEEMLS